MAQECELTMLYTKICFNKIYHAVKFDDTFLKLEKYSSMRRLVMA